MFIRIFRSSDRQELLLNADHISKIEVNYGIKGGDGDYWRVSMKDGIESPDAMRFYKVHVAGEVLLLAAKPGDLVMEYIETLYRNALKG